MNKDNGNEKNFTLEIYVRCFGQYYFGAFTEALSLAVRYENDEGDNDFSTLHNHTEQKSFRKTTNTFDEGLTDEIERYFTTAPKKTRRIAKLN